MKPSVLVTLPLPLVDTVSVKYTGFWVKAAVTARFWFMVRLHEPVPLQAPLHPVKYQPCAGDSFSVTGALLE
jgi:hypothetical protein